MILDASASLVSGFGVEVVKTIRDTVKARREAPKKTAVQSAKRAASGITNSALRGNRKAT